MPSTTDKRLLLHAPNVHMGGGAALLRGLLAASKISFAWAQLDGRIAGKNFGPRDMAVTWVRRSLFSRLIAEWRLYRACHADDVVLCFHGLPPLFPVRGRALVFAQNRLLFESGTLRSYPLITRVRLSIERWWTRRMARHCSEYIVQTKSMATLVRNSVGQRIAVSVLPFSPLHEERSGSSAFQVVAKHDFIYVASGEPHKNHANLLAAWRMLADEGLRPSLALTIDPVRYPALACEIEDVRVAYNLAISNCGWVPHEATRDLYQSSSALIYPSKVESFGLPLIEARQIGLPIIASELDYVRDVIVPEQSFDPNSPLSIARAVKRFLKIDDNLTKIHTPEEFWEALLQ